MLYSCFLGRFVHFKGFADVASAFLSLSETNPHARLLLIGVRDRLHPTGLSAEEERAMKGSPQIIDIGFRNDVERCLPAADVAGFPESARGNAGLRDGGAGGRRAGDHV